MLVRKVSSAVPPVRRGGQVGSAGITRCLSPATLFCRDKLKGGTNEDYPANLVPNSCSSQEAS